MSPELVQRYQRGGDIWASLAASYGGGAADSVARVARDTRDRMAVTAELDRVKRGAPLNQSTASILAVQLATDPLGAPLDAANEKLSTLAGNTALALLRNPLVLLVLLGLLLLWLGPSLLPILARRK
jgi:hypothetical protein